MENVNSSSHSYFTRFVDLLCSLDIDFEATVEDNYRFDEAIVLLKSVSAQYVLYESRKRDLDDLLDCSSFPLFREYGRSLAVTASRKFRTNPLPECWSSLMSVMDRFYSDIQHSDVDLGYESH